jgi:rubrerythrin
MDTPPITDLATFLSHALAMEREAAARYTQFAHQMLIHNRPELAKLFERLARLESEHHERLHEHANGVEAKIKPGEYRWTDPESPESAPIYTVPYLMSPIHALRLALANERRAQAFFERVAASNCPEEVRAVARQFAAEEEGHARALDLEIGNAGKTANDWRHDPDPATVAD